MPTLSALSTVSVFRSGTSERPHMPLLLLLLIAIAAGSIVGLVAWRYPRVGRAPAASPAGAARKVGETVGRHRGLRAMRDARLDPAAATGLALTARSVARDRRRAAARRARLSRAIELTSDRDRQRRRKMGKPARLGRVDARPQRDHAARLASTSSSASASCSPSSRRSGSGACGSPRSSWRRWAARSCSRTRSSSSPTGYGRPSIRPRQRLGPSFPSGHSATAAAFYATAALLIGRWRGRRARALLAGLAVGSRSRSPRAVSCSTCTGCPT